MTDNPYKKIGSVVEQWCEKNLYAQMLVTISVGYEWEPPHEETHLLDFDAEEGRLVWDSDWWEGQQHVELVGFTPLYKVMLEGEGEYARTVRHGRWIDTDNYYMRWKCSECGNHTRDARPPYCPNCGATMDLEAL